VIGRSCASRTRAVLHGSINPVVGDIHVKLAVAINIGQSKGLPGPPQVQRRAFGNLAENGFPVIEKYVRALANRVEHQVERSPFVVRRQSGNRHFLAFPRQ